VRTIVKKTVVLETKRFDFDNEFAYIEVWWNNHLKDCYFAEKQMLFQDGSVKPAGKKYFYSPMSGLWIEKDIKSIRCEKFRWFEQLYYFDEEGEIFRIDGTPAADCDYQSV
jgi:hypothetical protein